MRASGRTKEPEKNQGNKDGNSGESVKFDPCVARAKEISMKKTVRGIKWMIVGLLLVCFWPATADAQAETSPDEFKSGNVAHITPAPPAKVEFQGSFSLPFRVQCHGNKLAPGKYMLVVKTVGEDKMVTLQREGSDIVLKSRPIPPTSVSDEGHSAVLVRHGPGPNSHTLEGVYLENLKLVLFLDESGHTRFLDKMFAGLKRLPIS
jgi:hypothetical protein